MAKRLVPAVLRQLHQWMGMAAGVDSTDAELLRRFVADRDEAAFTAILRRHGPLVLGVCRQVLRHDDDADDAFQATFLVLARKAGSIRQQTSLAGWLHRVATNAALKARAGGALRQAHERQVVPMRTEPADDAAGHERQQVLHHEIDHLPQKYRVPIVLCYLQGKTHTEAAAELGWPVGTVKGRLGRAREVLHRRLVRRGLVLSAGGLLASLTESLATAAVPPVLERTALQGIVALAAGSPAAGGVSPQAVSLAEGMLRNMMIAKFKLGAVVVLTLGVLATGAGFFAHALSSQYADELGRPAPSGPVQAAPARLDAAGDPLPAGADARLGTVRFRHAGWVSSLAWLPDGKTVVSGSWDGTVRLWDTASGKELRRHAGHHITVAPDGKSWASWGGDDPIRLWDAATGKQRYEFKKPGTLVVTFSPDGKVLAAGGNDQDQLALWEVATGKELPAPKMGRKYDYVYRLAFAPDGKTIATSGDDDSTIRFWDLDSGKELPPLGENSQTFAYSPAGKIMALAGWDKTDRKTWTSLIRIFDVATRKEIRQLRGAPSDARALKGAASALTFSADGATLIVGGDDGLIRLWETATGKEVASLSEHRDVVTSLALSPDGKTLASGGRDRTVRLWDLATRKIKHSYPGHQGEISSIVLSPDGKTVISASWDKTVRLWDLATGGESRCLADPLPVRSIVLSPDGKTLASRSWTMSRNSSTLRLWDLNTGQERRQFPEMNDGSTAIAFSPDGRTLAAGNYLSVHHLDVATGKELSRAVASKEQSQSAGIPFVAFSPDGKAFTWSNNAYARVSDAATGKELRNIVIFRAADSLSSISWGVFCLNGQILLLNVDGASCLWDVARGKELRRFGVDARQRVLSQALSPDGRTLAVGYRDGTIRLWEVATGKERRQFQGHQGGTDHTSPWNQGGVTALAWSADGKVLVSGGADTTLLVWNVQSTGNAARPELGTLWTDLGGDDATPAYQSVRALVAAPEQSVPFLRERLQPAAAADPKRLARLIADLDSQGFPTRMKAAKELENLEGMAEAALRLALAGKPSLEAQQRLQQLVERLDRLLPSGQSLQHWRAVEVLEHIGTPEARQLLEKLSQGTVESRLTQAARAALDRLGKRPVAGR